MSQLEKLLEQFINTPFPGSNFNEEAGICKKGKERLKARVLARGKRQFNFATQTAPDKYN